MGDAAVSKADVQFVTTTERLPFEVKMTSIGLYIAASLCLWGMQTCARIYLDSTKMRTVVQESVLAEDDDASDEDKVIAAKKVFAAHPSTVSEMIHATEEIHGMLFQGLAMLAGVLAMVCSVNAACGE
jgi:hypothetical protein